MIHYLIQLLIFQALFLGVYELFLKKETFFSLNRVYLLVTPFLAAILPLLEFEILQNVVPMEGIVQLPTLIISENAAPQGASTALELTGEAGVRSVIPNAVEGWLFLGYLLGAVVSFILFFRKYLQLRQLKYSGKPEKHGKTIIVRVPNSHIACTFFNTIFLGEDLSETETSQILKHELVHMEQKHSWDLLLFEFLRIILWFNPFIYRYQSHLSTLHEYIADEKVVQKTEKNTYFQDLLNATFGTQKISFTNPFFNESLIKKRIMMLQKPKSKEVVKWKYLLVLPLVVSMLIIVACSQEQNPGQVDSDGVKTIEVESLKAISEEREAEIADEIQKIGTEYEKVIVSDSKNGISFVFTNNDWSEGFIENTEKGLKFRADKLIINEIENSTKKGPFELIAPDGVYFNFTENGADLLPPPPPSPPSPFDGDEIPFSVIESVPTFPGCENLADNQAQKECMSQKIAEFVNANFDISLSKKLGLTGKQRIQVLFKINENGEVVEVKARAPHPELEKEAVRVVGMLPNMSPGKQDGKTVNVLYSLPIIFQVQ